MVNYVHNHHLAELEVVFTRTPQDQLRSSTNGLDITVKLVRAYVTARWRWVADCCVWLRGGGVGGEVVEPAMMTVAAGWRWVVVEWLRWIRVMHGSRRAYNREMKVQRPE